MKMETIVIIVWVVFSILNMMSYYGCKMELSRERKKFGLLGMFASSNYIFNQYLKYWLIITVMAFLILFYLSTTGD